MLRKAMPIDWRSFMRTVHGNLVMRGSTLLQLLLQLLLLQTLLCGAALAEETDSNSTATAAAKRRAEPGPAKCHPGCEKHGTCGEEGQCRCPFGRLGKACEIDFLAPCRMGPGLGAYCGTAAAKSCECYKRCHEYLCQKDASGNTVCHFSFWPPAESRGCYVREGVEPDEQYSLVPEEDEQGVKYYQGFVEGAAEINRTTALAGEHWDTVALSQCPNNCSHRGYCMTNRGDIRPFCGCMRGFLGGSCELSENRCYLQCSGRGECEDQFCRCKPPYFSIGCTRSKVYPPNYSRPSPVNFKIYMYELNTRNAYDNVLHAGWQQHDYIYTAYQKFMEQFLTSSVRTEDPSEANMFYIPAFTYSYSGNGGVGDSHLNLLIDQIRKRWPYWNRTEGRDHFFWTTADRGACYLGGIAQQAIKLVNFGLYFPEKAVQQVRLEIGDDKWRNLRSPEYGCYHPLRDVVAPPWDLRIPGFMTRSLNMSLEQVLERKTKLFFFAGDTRMGDWEYSGLTRQLLFNLTQQWQDQEFMFVQGYVGNYEDMLRESKFCLAPYGHGWGIRLVQVVVTGCVPVIIQEHVYQPFEEVLPYEDFSLRLSNADLPHIRETLRAISDQQYRRLLENLLRWRDAFSWDVDSGGRAFDYTIATLRRRYLALKSPYY